MAYAANFIPEVWSKKLQKIFDNSTVMANLVNRDYEGEIKEAGDVVKVRTFGTITINDYTREQTIALESLTDPMSEMTIDQEKYFGFQVDDIDKVQSDINIVEGYNQRGAIAIRNVVDQSLHAQYVNVDGNNIIGTSGSPVTITADNVYDQIVDMGYLMDKSNAPSDGRHLVVNPRFKAALLKSPEFTRATDLGDKVIQNGMIGTVNGFQVHCSTNLNETGGNTPILGLTKDLISFASQVHKIEHSRPSLKFVDVVKGLYVYGSKVFTNHAGQGAVLWTAGT